MTYDLIHFRVPSEYAESTPSTYFTESIRQYRSANDNHQPKIITLMGGVGAGKTWDACAFLNHARSLGRTIAYVSACDLVKVDQHDYYKLEDRTVLVLDDYGQRLTPGALTRASELVNKRMINKGLFTIITTNLTTGISDLDERLGSRMNSGAIISYHGMPDRRIS